MKRWILLLIIFLIAGIGYKTGLIFAQEDKDTIEVKKVVGTFLKEPTYRDIDSAMEYISVNYFVRKDDDIIDYAKFKSGLEERQNTFFENHIDFSISDLKFYNLEIQDNKATLETKYNWKALNIDTSKEDSGKIKRRVTLTKENGIWKITQLLQI